MRIRRAEPADSSTLTTLARSAKASWGYPPDWLAQWESALTITPEYVAAHRVYVALEPDASGILGVCALEDHGQYWAIEHVWVRPDSHGRGVGRRLVEHVLAEARAIAPARPARVEADPYAAAFYARLGAREIGATPAPMDGDPNRTLPLFEFAAGERAASLDSSR